jgi:hypothetical protein
MDKGTTATSKIRVYKRGEHVAKSASQVGRNDRGDFVAGDGEVFEKWSQALASADDLVSAATDAHERHGKPLFFTVVLPVLVVSDDALWVADYSDAGVLERDPFQVEEATLFVGRSYSSTFGDAYTVSHLHVCTRKGIRAFLKRIAEDDALWDVIFPGNVIRRSIKRRLTGDWS